MQVLYKISEKQKHDLITKVQSIEAPAENFRRLWITLRSPVKVWYDNREKLESEFKSFRDLITRAKTKENDFRNVAGYFIREYGEEESGLHFHLMLFDYRPNLIRRPQSESDVFGATQSVLRTDLEIYLKERWIGLVQGMASPDYPVFLSKAEMRRCLFNVERINLDENGVPDLRLLDYFKKESQKSIKIQEGTVKHRWFGPINLKNLRYKNRLENLAA
jgi:hypothetical protein